MFLATNPVLRSLLALVLALSHVTPVAARTYSDAGFKRNGLSAQQLLDKGISALGGRSHLEALKGVTLDGELYRTQTTMQSFTPGFPDQSVAVSGNQTVSYSFSDSATALSQRIDRNFNVDQYWIFGRAFLEPYNASIVSQTGPKGFSCYVSGNENIGLPEDATWGYTDDALQSLFLREAMRWSPTLLLAAEKDPQLDAQTVISHGHSYPSIVSPQLGLTILLDPQSYLPYIVRAYEHHNIYGNSTSDLILYNHTSTAGVLIPRRYKVEYNSGAALIDALFYKVTANPTFHPDFFSGLPEDKINTTITQLAPGHIPKTTQYGSAEVFEFSQTTLWAGGYAGNLSNIAVTNPIKSIKNLYHLVFVDAPGYTCTIAVTNDAIFVTDAPPHQSLLVIKWIQNTFKRNPTHLLVTHHHHDHNYGAADFVAVGAKLVVPEDFTYYWDNIPRVQFEKVTVSQPFIYRSESIQIRAVWPGVKNIHALDWMYFTFSEGCPHKGSTIAVVEADAWNAHYPGPYFDQRLATQFLTIAESHGLPYGFLVIPIHGSPQNSSDLYVTAGYQYPYLEVDDFKPGGPWC